MTSFFSIYQRIRRVRPLARAIGLSIVFTACAPVFPNLEGAYINSSAIKDVIAQTEALTIRSTRNYKSLYFHMNTQMRSCLNSDPDSPGGFFLDSLLSEDMEYGELAILREKTGFGHQGVTYILIQSGAVGSKVVISTHEDHLLEMWVKWINGESGCFPDL